MRFMVIVAGLLSLVACSESKPSPDSWTNMCDDLTWLDSIQGAISQTGLPAEIYLTHYKNNRVFEVNVCNSCTDIPLLVFDCSGEIVCEIGGLAGVNTCPDYSPAEDDRLLFWKRD